ncbi:MAG: hypothetical protein KAU26_09920 [Methylococcales bacterium]|nr:hypothetical protein [Methylococcales bacterium]
MNLLDLNQPKIAISEDIGLVNFQEDNTVFPAMINLGSLQLGDSQLPALFPLSKMSGICFLTTQQNQAAINNSLQRLALRLMLSVPIGLGRFTFIDATGLGQNFKYLSKLSSKLIGHKILTENKEIGRALESLKQHTTNIIQKVIGHQYDSLEAYNRTAGEVAEPYTFLFLANFPQKMTTQHYDELLSLLENGYKAGIYVFLSLDTTYQKKSNYDIDALKFLDSQIPVIYEANEQFYVSKGLPCSKYFNYRFRFNLNCNIPEKINIIIEQINRSVAKTKKVEVEVTRYLTEELLWQQTAATDLIVPIGKISQTDVQYFALGEAESIYHALIGGITGSGKTVLLHNIICGTAWCYSPEEVQLILMDYKEGTEFKIYETLPHTKVLSIHSEREFGLSVLEYLRTEIEKRGELFKRFNVSNLKHYRQKSGDKLPRLLIIIDEFQVLLANNDRIARDVSDLLDDITKRGRSFGVNLLLCTQSLGEVFIKNSTLSQLGLRISLKLHPNDCPKILSQDNAVPSYFDKAGEAVYNTLNGLKEGNQKFQVGFLDNEKMTILLATLQQKLLSVYGKPLHKAIIFNGQTAANIEDNEGLMLSLKNKTFKRNNNFTDIFIGEPAYLDEHPISFRIRKQNESNVLIVGQDIETAIAIVYHSLWQLIKQSSENSQFYILDLFNIDSSHQGCLNDLLRLGGNVTIKTKAVDIERIINLIADELAQRIKYEADNQRIVLVIMDVQKARPLRKKGVMMSVLMARLMIVLNEGASYAVHCFVYAVNYNGLLDVLDPMSSQRFFNEFETKIALKGCDTQKVLGSGETVDSSSLGLIKSPYNIKYDVCKFKSYDFKEVKNIISTGKK